jgi:hypothetical protein
MNELLAIREIFERYPDEWVCVEETEWDPIGHPLAGRVIAHGASRNDLRRQTDQFRAAHPDSIIYFFYTGEPIPEGIEVILVAP